MSSALESLLADHREVEQLVLSLRTFISTLEEQEEGAARSDLAGFTAALDSFVDQYHHEKEEAVLLPFVVRSGLSWEEGPVAEVRREHRQERYLIEELQQASAQRRTWSQEDRRHIAATIRAVVEFEHAHLRKENAGLFPLILDRLNQEQLAELQSELVSFDRRAEAELLPVRAQLRHLTDRYLGGTSSEQAPQDRDGP